MATAAFSFLEENTPPCDRWRMNESLTPHVAALKTATCIRVRDYGFCPINRLVSAPDLGVYFCTRPT